LRNLQEHLEDLAEYRDITLSNYTANEKDQRVVERTLHLACKHCIDIAAYLASRKALGAPKDRKGQFSDLQGGGIITAPMTISIMKSAQFLNILFQDYARINPEIVIGILRRIVLRDSESETILYCVSPYKLIIPCLFIFRHVINSFS